MKKTNWLPNIIIIVGQTGAGKTELAKRLSKYYKIKYLQFSYAGKYQHQVINEPDELNNYLHYQLVCIFTAAKNNEHIIIDGISSQYIINNLNESQLSTCIIQLKTSEEKRLKRIAKREKCSKKEAMIHDLVKAEGKNALGQNKVISMADITIDGDTKKGKILKKAIKELRQCNPR